MSETSSFDLPGGAGRLLATEWVLPSWENDGTFERGVELRWFGDADDGRGHPLGSVATMPEATIAVAEISRILAAGEAPGFEETYRAAGFEGVAPRGLSVSGSPTWSRRIDGRWHAWFGNDPMETSLRLRDADPVPNRYLVVATLEVPYQMRDVLPPRSAVFERALLAILEARIGAGDPGMPLS